mgnify:CR=1 FL=1
MKIKNILKKLKLIRQWEFSKTELPPPGKIYKGKNINMSKAMRQALDKQDKDHPTSYFN